MMIILAIIGGLAYAILFWKMGRDFSNQVGINMELERQRKNLKPGFQVNEKWHSFKRKAMTRTILYSLILIAIISSVAYYSFVNDFRLKFVGLNVLLAILPSLMGFFGVIPIPGVAIND